MFSYAVHELRFSEDAALKRIQAARTARQYPAIFDAVADGRLHLSGVNLLAPHLTAETVDELLADATHKTKSEIESLLACRFPKPDVPTRIAPVAPPSPPVAQHDLDGTPVAQHAPGHVESLVPRDKVSPLSAERVALQLTMRRSTHEKILYAQALLSHQLAHGDIAGVIDRALDALIATLEKRRFAATETPRPTR